MNLKKHTGRDLIVEELEGLIAQHFDIGQFGGQAGKGTEHMMVFLVDRILKLLDSTTDIAAFIATMVDGAMPLIGRTKPWLLRNSSAWG